VEDKMVAGKPLEPEESVDVEKIMQQIRAEILNQRSARVKDSHIAAGITGRRFPPEFYDHLYQAGLTFDVGHVQADLTPITVPVAGPLLQWLRRKFHDLVIFYVARLADQQAEVNQHLLSALSILSRELERLPPAGELEALVDQEHRADGEEK
jgi:hypothetical protein